MSAVVEQEASIVRKEKASELNGRLEDYRLLTGKGRYVDDLSMEGQTYMGIVRSPFAHAVIKRIDFSKLQTSPDFIAALTGEDLLKEGVAVVSELPVPAHKFANRHQLAVGKVRFSGEAVAAILVKSKSSLEDLIDQVEVDYEKLPAVTSIEESRKGGTLVYENWSDNIYLSFSRRRGNAETAIAAAPHVIRTREGIERQEAMPMEPRSVLVSYKREEDLYEVYATVQSVHFLRQYLSSELKIPEAKFHVKVMDVGGGFGSKGGNSYPEPVLACLFSRRTGLPVKWTATRTEEFQEAAAGRDEYCNVTLACDKNGRIVALKAGIECDVGVSGSSAFMPSATVGFMLGTYKIPNLDLDVKCYVSNKMPVGPVRGAGRPEGCYFIERAMEIMAKKVGLDPIELRRRNVPEPEPPNSRSYRNLLDTFVGKARYEEVQRWRDDLNARYKEQKRGPALVAGMGVSLLGGEEGFSVRSMLAGMSLRGMVGMIRMLPRFRDFMGESGRVTLNRLGEVRVYTGSSPHGQGHETVFAQLASEELGVPIDRVKVIWGDTVLIPRGVGTFGSRSAAAGGSAVVDASRRLKSDLIQKASKILGKDQSSLGICNGNIVEARRPQNALIGVGEVLNRLGLTEISADSKYRPSSEEYSSSVHLCAVTLDPKLGTVRIVKYVVVEDCGRMINEVIVDGQLHGGVVHAVGGSLFEKVAHDDEGNLLTSTMMDYSIPTALASPNIEIFHTGTPSTSALDGAKGVGESGTMAGYAAVMNAINDALAQVRPGAHLDIAPATPDAIVAAVEADSGADSAGGRG